MTRPDDTFRALGAFVSADGTLTAPARSLAVEAVWTATGHERQVFLDQSGRRRRRCGALGALVAVFAVMWLTAVVSGPVGFSNLPSVRISSLRPLPVAVAVARHGHASHGQTRRRAGHRVDVADAGSVVGAKRPAARPSGLD